MKQGRGYTRLIPNEYKTSGDHSLLIIRRRNGKIFEVLIDTDDVQMLSEWHWHIYSNGAKNYVHGRNELTGYQIFKMHRVITGCPPDLCVDHINHNTLDNRKQNLRMVTNGENQQNLRGARQSSKSGARGVHWCKRGQRWVGQVRCGKKTVFYKKFHTLDDAIYAVTQARLATMPFTTN